MRAMTRRAMTRKAALRAQLAAHLTEALASARAAHAAAIEGATHPEARAENDKDTRGLEQSYLARGQARRVAELEAELGGVEAMRLRMFDAREPVAIGAIVEVGADDTTHRYLLAPGGGGVVLDDGLHVITGSSPLGRTLLNKHIGDVVEVRGRELEIVEIE